MIEPQKQHKTPARVKCFNGNKPFSLISWCCKKRMKLHSQKRQSKSYHSDVYYILNLCVPVIIHKPSISKLHNGISSNAMKSKNSPTIGDLLFESRKFQSLHTKKEPGTPKQTCTPWRSNSLANGKIPKITSAPELSTKITACIRVKMSVKEQASNVLDTCQKRS